MLDEEGQDEQQLQQNKMFFTTENLVNIFLQIKNQEQDPDNEKEEQYQPETITHSTVVDVLYNVLTQIKGEN